jgi:hypothetical protein
VLPWVWCIYSSRLTLSVPRWYTMVEAILCSLGILQTKQYVAIEA